MNEQITIPADGIWILNRLQEHGYVGYAVGGCVRDALLHRTPHDWDFCTSATPEQIQACFSDVPCLTIGSQHGTIGVLRNHTIYEITTFRKETTYHDHRHPDAVQFADSLQTDLQRRDFTINAMAYHPETGIIDPFHGAADLQKRQLRCVGVPTERFTEDALRILRAVRFAAVYGLTIQPETAAAMERTAPFLKWVSAERILSECDRIVTAPYAAATLAAYPAIWFSLFPEIQPLQGFQQQHPRHAYDVWEHSLLALSHSHQQDTVLCWAALLHDIGKPACFHRDAAGIGHFYGHPAESAALAKQICKRLKMDRKRTDAIVALITAHEVQLLPQRSYLLRMLQKYGAVQTKRLFALRKADLQAQVPVYAEQDLQKLEQMQQLLQELLQEQACFQLKDLAIRGNDLLAMGIPKGVLIGKLLQDALEQVIRGKLPNEREALLQWVQERWNRRKQHQNPTD